MKKRFLAFGLLLFALNVLSQNTYTRPAAGENKPPHDNIVSDSLPRFYLGFGTGINNYVGIIGVGMDVRVYQGFLIRAGAGISTWGTKLSLGFKYELTPGLRGWTIGITYCYCSGLKNFQTQLAVDTSATVSGTIDKQVTLNLNPASAISLSASYNWMLHKRHKFYIEFGYALALQSAPFQVLDGSKLDYSSATTLRILSPGGIVIDCGFMFALK